MCFHPLYRCLCEYYLSIYMFKSCINRFGSQQASLCSLPIIGNRKKITTDYIAMAAAFTKGGWKKGLFECDPALLVQTWCCAPCTAAEIHEHLGKETFLGLSKCLA